MGKFTINKNDKSRILLTELLPYEVPILFSNEGFYLYYQERKTSNCPNLIEKLLTVRDSDYKIPFSYKIRKSADSVRVLSLIHPAIQVKFIDFYQKYDSLIIHLCSRSPISLRFPSKVASHFFFNDGNKDKMVEEETETVEVEKSGFEQDLAYSSSYFTYKRYGFLFKFYDSYEFLRLEKKFKHLLLFDISKCFDSIYTHSISWAVKDKEFAKANTYNKSFEADFDKLMQRSNYNETNGILIGSEVSRLFAEIILQRIDLNVIEKLRQRNLHLGANYVVRRYVDDYFIFSNDENLGKEILKEFQSELEDYKLHINKSKTETLNTPFITGITIGRIELRKLLDDFFSRHVSYDEYEVVSTTGSETEKKVQIQILDFKNLNNTANSLIRDIKSIIKRQNIEYESISGLTFSMFKKKLELIYKNFDGKELDEVQRTKLNNFLMVTFDVMFFIYSMDYRVRATYIMAQIIISTNKYLSTCKDDIKHTISKKIYDESLYLLKNMGQDSNHSNVEFLNLLISLKDLGKEYLIETDSLIALLDIENRVSKFSYFHFVIILYYIEDIAQYEYVRRKIEAEVILKIKSEVNPFHKTELTCLLFDLVRCPYVGRQVKEELIEMAFKKVENRSPSLEDRNRVINYISNRNWFVNWNKDIELGSFLLKKELRTPY